MLNLEKIPGILMAFSLTIQMTVAQDLLHFAEKRPALGTTVSITCYATDSSSANQAMSRAFELLNELNNIFSDYNPSSEIMQISSSYKPGRDVLVSKPLFELTQQAIEIRDMTGGSFNIAVGALTNLWRSWLVKDEIPPKRKILRYRRHLDPANLVVIAPDRICLKKKAMRLDFGGIAKGYIGDQMAKVMENEGVYIYLIDLGGDLVAGSPPPDSDSWKITISWCQKVVHIANQAIATSGPDFQFFVHQGERYAHIIDPATGWGVTNIFGSTVIAPSGTEADALASAFSILSLPKSSELLRRKTDIAAIIGRDNELIQSDNFSSYVVSSGHTN